MINKAMLAGQQAKPQALDASSNNSNPQKCTCRSMRLEALLMFLSAACVEQAGRQADRQGHHQLCRFLPADVKGLVVIHAVR